MSVRVTGKKILINIFKNFEFKHREYMDCLLVNKQISNLIYRDSFKILE